MTTEIPRRTFLYQALASAGMLIGLPYQALSAVALLVPNVTQINSVNVQRIFAPTTVAEISGAIREWTGKIAIGGGRFSMGGQIAVEGGLHLDMRELKRLVWFKPEERLVRVQAGMRWRDLHDVIDPHELAVHTMQSYSNFTIGGSVSVNAHGRYVGHGPVCNSVAAIQLVLADGSVVEASRSTNPELFSAALGGYGAVGVITEVELILKENIRIERIAQEIALANYVNFFEKNIGNDDNCIMHNADLMPPLFQNPVAVTWRKTDKPLTEPTRLVPRGQSYALEQNMLWVMTEIPGGENLRKSVLHPLLTSNPVVKWLNHEASLDVAELEPRTRTISTYALQEYFIPPAYVTQFAYTLSRVLRQHRVEAVNVSIRHSPKDTVSLLPWAKEEVFSFVLYYKQRTHLKAQKATGKWTRELIDEALENHGRYYLPYQLHASQDQFDRAYPEADLLRLIKKKFDPNGKFSNEMWDKYL